MRKPFALPRAYITLFLITLIFRIATAFPLEQAGYMDASYTIHVAENLARGRGLVEDVLWNYLDNPAGLPHPSNLYWMPLPSLLIVPCFAIFGVSYHAAQIPNIILSSLLPLFAFYLARRIFRRDDYAWAAGLFTTFSGFYTIYWVSPDNFAPFALMASVCLYLIVRGTETISARYFFFAGILIAFAHLSRADGLFLLVVVPLALFIHQPTHSLKHCSLFTVYCLLGYLLFMSPWFLRNYIAVGTPYPSAGTKTLWLTNYDELFRYADDLTWQRYLAWGINKIIGSKFAALGQNLLVVAFGALQVFLAPFAIIGVWQLRRRIEMLPFLIYSAILFLAMSFVFTFPSTRGSMLHSSSALLPFLAVAVPLGLDSSIQWIARRRRTWRPAQASLVFRSGFIVLAIFLSLFLYAQGVFPINNNSGDIPLWNRRDLEYASIAKWLDQNARTEDKVMTVDPPSFYNVSHRQAIAIPTDSVAAIFQAAQRYDATYLILQLDHPAPLNNLYHERATIPGLERVADFRDGNGKPAMLYKIRP